MKYDYCISSPDRKTLKDILGIDAPKDKFIRMGYSRKLPQWTKFVEREALKLPYKKYVFFALTGLGRRLEINEPELIVNLTQVLWVLRKYNNDILTVFKPHITTEMDKFQAVLKKVAFRNYEIDYGHPMILAKKCHFALGYSFSSVFFDAFYLGKPVVSYVNYDPRLTKMLHGKSEGLTCCDHFINGDQEELDRVLKQLIFSDNTQIKRDPKFIEENFPDTSEDFWEFWEEIL